jgi:hypothetical protein
VHAPSPAYDAGTQLGRPKRARSPLERARALRTDAEAPIRTCRWCSHRDARQATVKDAASRLRSKTPTTPRMVNERHSRKDGHIARYHHAWRTFLALPNARRRLVYRGDQQRGRRNKRPLESFHPARTRRRIAIAQPLGGTPPIALRRGDRTQPTTTQANRGATAYRRCGRTRTAATPAQKRRVATARTRAARNLLTR